MLENTQPVLETTTTSTTMAKERFITARKVYTVLCCISLAIGLFATAFTLTMNIAKGVSAWFTTTLFECIFTTLPYLLSGVLLLASKLEKDSSIAISIFINFAYYPLFILLTTVGLIFAVSINNTLYPNYEKGAIEGIITAVQLAITVLILIPTQITFGILLASRKAYYSDKKLK